MLGRPGEEVRPGGPGLQHLPRGGDHHLVPVGGELPELGEDGTWQEPGEDMDWFGYNFREMINILRFTCFMIIIIFFCIKIQKKIMLFFTVVLNTNTNQFQFQWMLFTTYITLFLPSFQLHLEHAISSQLILLTNSCQLFKYISLYVQNWLWYKVFILEFFVANLINTSEMQSFHEHIYLFCH